MASPFLALTSKSIQHLKPYVPGKPIAELERELGITNIIKLASNENPLGSSPKALQALKSVLHETHLYPDGNGFELKTALAQQLNIQTNQITLGNGSDSLFMLIGQAFVPLGKEIIVSQYAFIVYSIVAHTIDAKLITVPAAKWGHDLEKMQQAVNENTRVIFIANPNNPTGTWVTHDALLQFLTQIPPQVLVVLDEAYYEFMDEADYPDGLTLQKQFPNLIITRTFSKIYGLAGLRVGYAISHPDIADILNRIRGTFNVGTLAQKAATAALSDDSFIQQTLTMNQAGIAFLTSEFDRLAINYLPPSGNFITIDLKQNAQVIYQKLLQDGIIVRPIHNYGMPEHLRITVGLAHENQRLINRLGLLQMLKGE